MSIKVAIASSDKTNIDLHFGQASQFEIYELNGDHFDFLETREAPKAEQTAEEVPAGDAGCSSGFGCGSGCGSGCGGGCGGGAGGPVSPVVESLLDCRAIVAAQIGLNVRRQFERNAVSVFDIELPIEKALSKLAAYYLSPAARGLV